MAGDSATSELLDAAWGYAFRGWRVFPLHWPVGDRCSCGKGDCQSEAKHPRTKNGLQNATSDTNEVESWWEKWPRANIGVRTGALSEIVVVDVDSYHGGDEGLADLEAEHGPFPPTLVSDTGGGGRHLVYAHPLGDRLIRNRAGLAKGVDLRGDGGYIVAPPSVHLSGRAYSWRDPKVRPAPLPAWLIEPKREERPEPIQPLPNRRAPGEVHPWALAALNGEVGDMCRAREGGRNHQLNDSAFNLGQLVPHALDEADVVSALTEAALAVGLGAREIEGTLQSGLQDGKERPRPIPERELVPRRPPRERPGPGLHGPDEAEPERPKLLELRWVTDVYAKPPTKPLTLVEGMLRKGELCAIGAPRAIGKSWFGMNLAVLLGQGEGRLADVLPIQRQCKVMYAQGELDDWDAYDRWTMLAGADPPINVAETFDRWRIRVVRRRSMTAGRETEGNWSESDEYVEAILDPRMASTIKASAIDVLIIDPWAVYYSGAENSNDEVEAAIDKLRVLAQTTEVAIVIFHHLRKGTADVAEPEDLWRGASRLADGVSTRVTIIPHFSDAQARALQYSRREARRHVDVRFLRRGTPTDDFTMRLEDNGWWKWWQPQGIEARAVATEPVHLQVKDVAELCHQAGGWDTQSDAVEALRPFGVGRDAAIDLLKKATAAEWLEATSHGNKAIRYDYKPF